MGYTDRQYEQTARDDAAFESRFTEVNPDAERGFHLKGIAGGVVFTRCADCRKGFHLTMWNKAPTVICPDCYHEQPRP